MKEPDPPQIRAAIIGLWRQGNDDVVIALLVGVEVSEVEKTIRDYKEKHPDTKNLMP